MLESRQLVTAALSALSERNCQNPALFSVAEHVGYTDFIIVGTGRSSRQIRAMADEVERVLRELGEKLIGVEGKEGGEWILVDFGALVVHLFLEETRDYYQMDTLWAPFLVPSESLQ